MQKRRSEDSGATCKAALHVGPVSECGSDVERKSSSAQRRKGARSQSTMFFGGRVADRTGWLLRVVIERAPPGAQ